MTVFSVKCCKNMIQNKIYLWRRDLMMLDDVQNLKIQPGYLSFLSRDLIHKTYFDVPKIVNIYFFV
ncbi:hypothetical protein KUTeg_003063 [Tegillarca granosa]|uniref:Uncharacterized protein n=1 Tax=Tegillarca granosa TaxID=220873 RepID=A0ABQ9FMW0_TEGGR|nr:hypothetical protein KUTeg_003063 [Tegillarca granosa]